MGLLDGMLGNVMGAALGGGQASQGSDPLGAILSSLTSGNQSQSGGLLTAALALLQQNGGLESVIGAFHRSGMSSQVDSWVGTGPNAALSASQLEQAVGSPALGQIASQLGMSHGQAGSALAQILPELINQLTPGGSLPDNHSDLIAQGLSMLRGKMS